MAYLQLGCGILLAVVFGWSVVGKLRSRTAFRGFADSLAPLVRRTTPVAVLLTGAEALVPALLPVVPVLGFGLAAVVLAVLTAGVLTAVRRRLTIRCRCFGGTGTRLGVRHVVRNLLLFVVSGLGLAVTATAGPTPSTGGAGMFLSAGVAVVLATVVIHLDDLVELWA
jgi:hypothetical protein